MIEHQSEFRQDSSSPCNLLNFSRVLSIVSLPLSIVQSIIFFIYLLKFQHLHYYHGISVEVFVHICLIYGTFYKKPNFFVPFIVLQIVAGLIYLFLATHFCYQIAAACGSLFHCPPNYLEDMENKIQFMFGASLSIPFQCAVAAIMLKCYNELKRRQKREEPCNI